MARNEAEVEPEANAKRRAAVARVEEEKLSLTEEYVPTVHTESIKE